MAETYDRIVKEGWVVLPEGVRKLDIGIKGGIIAALDERLDSDGAEVLDARGRYVFPGMIDMHVHFNEPNFGHWEGFATGSSALAAGGCTAYADMPLNGNPPAVNVPALSLKAEAAAGNSAVDYMLWGGLVPDNLEELERLAAAGVVGFKTFLSNPGGEGEGRFREADDETLYRGMQKIAGFGGILALHAESEGITSALAAAALAEGRTGAAGFAATRPPEAELEAVGRALLYAGRTGCRLHFVHISTAAAVELIAAAKSRGLDVSLETCPHYLLLTENDMASLGPVAKCAPPLRSLDEREKLWQTLLAGQIDMIASDHSPCPPNLKLAPALTFLSAWGGISGAQSSMELMFHEGVNRRGMRPELLARLLSQGPARRFGLEESKGAIALGLDADLAVLDPHQGYRLTEHELLYRHKISPYTGMELSCRITHTFSRGALVYELGRGVPEAAAASGRPVVFREGKAVR